MKLLLDTQLYLWAVDDSRKLSRRARSALVEAESIAISAASIWEAAIKIALGKLKGDPTELAAAIAGSGFIELAVSAAHAARVAALPPIHGDPFDRLLIAQAMHEPLRLLTADPVLARYSELVVVV